MRATNPYLNFNGNTEEAFTFYRSVFGGEFLDVIRFRDLGDNMGAPEHEMHRIAHISLPLGEHNILMGTDVLECSGRKAAGNNFYIHLAAETEQEADRLFGALATDGTVEMPLQGTEWSQKYGALSDRFGIQWMVDYTGSKQFDASQRG